MSEGFDIYVEEGLRCKQIFDRIREFLAEVKEQVLKLLPDSEVYLFGSVARGRYTAASDIDILVVTGLTDREAIDRAKARLSRMFIDAPVEFHVVDRVLFEKWYRRFISVDELVRL